MNLPSCSALCTSLQVRSKPPPGLAGAMHSVFSRAPAAKAVRALAETAAAMNLEAMLMKVSPRRGGILATEVLR
ncbi:hypothetical protein D3C87_1996370 [compost metagenome]